MEYRHLGKSGLRVSALSFGSWVTFANQLDERHAMDCMKTAFDAGVNFFDNAEAYAGGQAETLMGKAIKQAGWKRSDLVISTKLFWGGKGPNERGLSRKHLMEGIKASLTRLDMDYVDLLFCHRADSETPIEEVVWTMTCLIRQGLVFYWGTSEWSHDEIREACEIARREHLIAPTTEQPQYHLFHRERVEKEYAPLYRDYGLGTTIWSPLASGMLTGKYNKGIPKGSRLTVKGYEWLREDFENEEGKRRLEKVQALMPVASDLNGSMAQLALAWCLKNPNVSTVITGASTAKQVSENMKALDIVGKLTPEVMNRIDAILSG